MDYIDFLKNKMAISHNTGFDINEDELTPTLYPHVKDTVRWAIKGGCRAIFSSFGMQKTVTQLEILRLIVKYEGGNALVVCPKRVVVEFVSQAKEHLNMDVLYVRRLIERYSNKGELVFDPFGGIGTVPYCAVKMGRKGLSTELNYDYWRDSLAYMQEAECDVTSPTLFDFLEAI